MHHTSRYGVEPFDVGYGASYNVEPDSALDMECPIVEDGGVLTLHDPPEAGIPDRLAFVDGTMRTEARMTRIEPDGSITTGLSGSWAVGAVLAVVDQPLRIEHVEYGRLAVFCGGKPTVIPEQPGGWMWDPVAVDGTDIHAARQGLQRRMREAEGGLAERLCDEDWLTLVDGPLSNIRRSRTDPVVGYVKTHHRRMLAPESWALIPELTVGQRSSMFAIGDDVHGCYLRVGMPGPWASAWAGIVRLEVPAGAGRDQAAEAVSNAAAWLPRYASAPHRDKRAPVNLTPIAGLEAELRRYAGSPELALRAVRAAILELNASETSS